MDKPWIRREAEADITAIRHIVARSYEQAEYSAHNLPKIVESLRDADVLSLSLVAIQGLDLAGYIAASPITISDGTGGWYGLGPVAVDPEYQNAGIGRALMEAALKELREGGAGGVVSLGDPEFYLRFGFRKIEGLAFRNAPEGQLLALNLGDSTTPQDFVSYHAAFGQPDWDKQ
ncbi:GNAT family N-acetyltransferase [Corynebacterium sp. A21]|uniref:GNAT family N-acetyltransferase n=1 Tax=Corynebacterium sp. A21 TaxID=3457318 RepID=UPI003FD0F797